MKKEVVMDDAQVWSDIVYSLAMYIGQHDLDVYYHDNCRYIILSRLFLFLHSPSRCGELLPRLRQELDCLCPISGLLTAADRSQGITTGTLRACNMSLRRVSP